MVQVGGKDSRRVGGKEGRFDSVRCRSGPLSGSTHRHGFIGSLAAIAIPQGGPAAGHSTGQGAHSLRMENYQILGLVGEGSFGKVRLAACARTRSLARPRAACGPHTSSP